MFQNPNHNMLAFTKRFAPLLVPIALILLLGLYCSWVPSSTISSMSSPSVLLIPSGLKKKKSKYNLYFMLFTERRGNGFHIFRPFKNFNGHHRVSIPLFSPPRSWIEHFIDRIVRNNNNVDNPIYDAMTVARSAYLELLLNFVSAISLGNEEFSVETILQKKLRVSPFNATSRASGLDWTYFGMTMTGAARLHSLLSLLRKVFESDVDGVFVEAGVWRGGSSILAQGAMLAYNESHRHVVVCDSFCGLPPGKNEYHAGDLGWDMTPYLQVSDSEVASNFQKFGLLAPNVIFAKGFFNASMPILRSQIQNISILRLDGDISQSTVDVLYHLYDRVSVGGYVIVDDWFGFPAKQACIDFFQAHNTHPIVIPIDNNAAFWQITQIVSIQYWRYRNKTFT